jgi:hypothetical protein
MEATPRQVPSGSLGSASLIPCVQAFPAGVHG